MVCRVFFFFKQKTAYELRMSDWSSDVCSSDLTFEGYATAVIDVDSPQMAAIEQLCRDNLLTVRDPDLRQKLTPDYRPACKRLVISDRFRSDERRVGKGCVSPFRPSRSPSDSKETE